MVEITAPGKRVLPLGIQGEHNARSIRFPETATWKEQYPSGTISLWHRRPGEEAHYPCVLDFEPDGTAVWKITASDTQIASSGAEPGMAELRCTSDHAVVKSSMFTTIIQPSLGGEQIEPPEPARTWVDNVLQAAESAEDAEANAKEAAESVKDAEANAKEAAKSAEESKEAAADAAKLAENFAAAIKESLGDVGDIDAALDAILALQEAYIRGDTK